MKQRIIELDESEIALILEAVKKQIKAVEWEKFYRREHPGVFYDGFIKKYYSIVKKLDRRIPYPVFIKMPKF